MTTFVRYENADGVGTVTLDSPHNRNALSRRLVRQLGEALDVAGTDDSRVIVIRSAHRVFCSGADLTEAADGGMAQGARDLVEMQRTIIAHPKPILARVEGPVRAGGLGIVAASDIAICQDDVTFAFTESRLGLAPAVISLSVLPRLTNRSAFDTFLTGRAFDAAEAAAMGLVTRSVSADSLDDSVEAVCAELIAAHPQGLRETKALLARDILAGIDARASDLIELSSRLFGSDAAREAMTAFLRH